MKATISAIACGFFAITAVTGSGRTRGHVHGKILRFPLQFDAFGVPSATVIVPGFDLEDDGLTRLSVVPHTNLIAYRKRGTGEADAEVFVTGGDNEPLQLDWAKTHVRTPRPEPIASNYGSRTLGVGPGGALLRKEASVAVIRRQGGDEGEMIMGNNRDEFERESVPDSAVYAEFRHSPHHAPKLSVMTTVDLVETELSALEQTKLGREISSDSPPPRASVLVRTQLDGPRKAIMSVSPSLANDLKSRLLAMGAVVARAPA